jgi:hypothetical protein
MVWYDQYQRAIYLSDGSDLPIIGGKGLHQVFESMIVGLLRGGVNQ